MPRVIRLSSSGRPRRGGVCRRGFTLIEMLVVIAIIGLLAGMLLPVLNMARRRARMTKCIGQLREFMHAVVMYRNAYDDYYPPWLSTLYPEYIGSAKVFICPADRSSGKEGGKPDWFAEVGDSGRFTETDDNGNSTSTDIKDGAPVVNYRNPAITACSYLYEFTWTKCSWWDQTKTWADFDKNGYVSWLEAKQTEMQGIVGVDANGKFIIDESEAYDGHVPMIRCFWHARRDDRLWDEVVLNVACGNMNIYECEVEGGSWKRAAR